MAEGSVLFRDTVTTVDMNDAAHTMTIAPTTTTGETQILGRIWFVDPNGNTEILTLPAEADVLGGWFLIVNTGGETITVNNDAAGTVCTIATTECALVACDGTTWYGGVVTTT